MIGPAASPATSSVTSPAQTRAANDVDEAQARVRLQMQSALLVDDRRARAEAVSEAERLISPWARSTIYRRR